MDYVIGIDNPTHKHHKRYQRAVNRLTAAGLHAFTMAYVWGVYGTAVFVDLVIFLGIAFMWIAGGIVALTIALLILVVVAEWAYALTPKVVRYFCGHDQSDNRPKHRSNDLGDDGWC